MTAAGSFAEACQDVDYIVTALPKTEHVENAVAGAGGILDSAGKGTMICDVSTISPHASRALADKATAKDMVFCDTPMSGGIMGAQAASLTFMVGASTVDDFERARIVLEGMGKKVFHCGDIGTGEIAKIVNNKIIGSQMLAAAEGMNLGKTLGIDPKKLQEILAVSTSSCWVTNGTNPVPGVVEISPASRDYEGGF